jgi:cellulase/cellobiase CelA1
LRLSSSLVKALSPLLGGVVAAALAASAVVGARTELASGCSVDYTVRSQWRDGFTADVRVTNRGVAIREWTLSWTFPGGQRVASGWNGDWSQSGETVSVRGIDSGAVLGTGSSASVGFHASPGRTAYGRTNPPPAQFLLDGVACTRSVERTPVMAGTGSAAMK